MLERKIQQATDTTQKEPSVLIQVKHARKKEKEAASDNSVYFRSTSRSEFSDDDDSSSSRTTSSCQSRSPSPEPEQIEEEAQKKADNDYCKKLTNAIPNFEEPRFTQHQDALREVSKILENKIWAIKHKKDKSADLNELYLLDQLIAQIHKTLSATAEQREDELRLLKIKARVFPEWLHTIADVTIPFLTAAIAAGICFSLHFVFPALPLISAAMLGFGVGRYMGCYPPIQSALRKYVVRFMSLFGCSALEPTIIKLVDSMKHTDSSDKNPSSPHSPSLQQCTTHTLLKSILKPESNQNLMFDLIHLLNIDRSKAILERNNEKIKHVENAIREAERFNTLLLSQKPSPQEQLDSLLLLEEKYKDRPDEWHWMAKWVIPCILIAGMAFACGLAIHLLVFNAVYIHVADTVLGFFIKFAGQYQSSIETSCNATAIPMGCQLLANALWVRLFQSPVHTQITTIKNNLKAKLPDKEKVLLERTM